MAKKKKNNRKRPAARPQGVAAEATPLAANAAQTPDQPAPAVAPRVAAAATATRPDPRWGYVGRDFRRIVAIITGCIALELLLWYLFSNTSLGPSVYQLIKI